MKAVSTNKGFTLIETVLGLALLSLVVLTWVGFVSIDPNHKKRIIETDELHAVRNHIEHALREKTIEQFPYDFVYESYAISIKVINVDNSQKHIPIVQAD